MIRLAARSASFCGAAILLLLVALEACDAFGARSPGEALWRGRCAKCHGLDGRGNTPRYLGTPEADLRDDLWRDTTGDPTDLERVVRTGAGEMPDNSDLSDEQVRQVVGYLLSLRGENAR